MANTVFEAVLSGRQNQEEDDFYSLLGCDENACTEQIITEYKIRALNLHPDKNPDDEHALENFKSLQFAKDTLADPEKRKKYDKWRCSGLAIPFKDWLGLRSHVHTSMHWATRKKKDLMLISGNTSTAAEGPMKVQSDSTISGTSNDQPDQVVWLTSEQNQWKQSTLLQKFRNYEI